MRDPFMSPPAVLKAAFEPLAHSLSLHTLPLHVHEIFFAFTLYHLIWLYVGPVMSSRFIGSTYINLNRQGKLKWRMQCVSLVQSSLITTMALSVMCIDKERRDMTHEERIWGYTGAAGMVQAFAVGYFLWDSMIMVQHLDTFGSSMLIHGLSCLFTFSLGFRPILNYYGCVFMLYEMSTIFLNIHLLLDKLGKTGSKIQVYNGVLLLLVFFFCRLVYGGVSSIKLYSDVWTALYIRTSHEYVEGILTPSEEGVFAYANERIIPLWTVVVYLAGHIMLNSLNVYWFFKMITAFKRRISKEKGT